VGTGPFSPVVARTVDELLPGPLRPGLLERSTQLGDSRVT
jgi:hypothetical protein